MTSRSWLLELPVFQGTVTAWRARGARIPGNTSTNALASLVHIPWNMETTKLTPEWMRLAGLYMRAVDAVRRADWNRDISDEDYGALIDALERAFAALQQAHNALQQAK